MLGRIKNEIERTEILEYTIIDHIRETNLSEKIILKR